MGELTPRDDPIGRIGGSALPGGVMMRTRTRVGVAVRREDDGAIVTEGFELDAPRGRWARWPLMRGVVAIHSALQTGRKSMAIGERLRWEEPAAAQARHGSAADAIEAAEEGMGTWAKVAVGAGALLGAGLQIALFRIGPVVIAKEAGLTGAAFIVADAAIRLALLLGMLWALSFLPHFRKILRYHGAEHQAIAALEAGAPLTAAVASGFSRFHPRCGTSFLVVSAVVSIAVYGAVLAITGVFTYPALIATRLIGAPIVTAIAFELQRQAAKLSNGPYRFLSSPGMWAQRLTTAKPGREELEVACAALAVALEQPESARSTAREPAAEAEAGPEVEPAPPLGHPQPSI